MIDLIFKCFYKRTKSKIVVTNKILLKQGDFRNTMFGE